MVIHKFETLRARRLFNTRPARLKKTAQRSVVKLRHRKLIREKTTLEAMVRIYCRGVHKSNKKLCLPCSTVLDYACQRLEKCPYQPDKPVCSECRIHCYRPAMRREIVSVMRYAGPRMFLRHPLLTLAHLSRKRRSGTGENRRWEKPE